MNMTKEIAVLNEKYEVIVRQIYIGQETVFNQLCFEALEELKIGKDRFQQSQRAYLGDPSVMDAMKDAIEMGCPSARTMQTNQPLANSLMNSVLDQNRGKPLLEKRDTQNAIDEVYERQQKSKMLKRRSLSLGHNLTSKKDCIKNDDQYKEKKKGGEGRGAGSKSESDSCANDQDEYGEVDSKKNGGNQVTNLEDVIQIQIQRAKIHDQVFVDKGISEDKLEDSIIFHMALQPNVDPSNLNISALR